MQRQHVNQPRRILIVGAGFAGMWSALSAARVCDLAGETAHAVEIAVIAPEPFLHVRPRLYESGPANMKAPLLDLFNVVGVKFIAGTVAKIMADADVVEAIGADGVRFGLPYDRLVLASGSRLFMPDIPGLREHAFNVDQIENAARLEAHVSGLAALPSTPARNTIVVVGGGFTGIETATEMTGRLCAILGNSADTCVVIVEQADEIGPDLGPGPRPIITQALQELGVSRRLKTAVQSIDAGGIRTTAGEYIESRTVIWTAGMRASALTAQIPGEKDRFGRLAVDRDLRVTGLRRVFASGDVSRAATDDDGHFTMMSCQHAMNLGRSAGHNAAADLLGLPTRSYEQPKYVTCLDLGTWGAVYTEGWDRQVKLSGAAAKNVKRQITTKWIYPPPADRAAAFAAADPARIIVA